MAKSYYSIALDHTADQVWATIRSFGDYAWAGIRSETTLEDGKFGDQVGAIRRFQVSDKQIRQRLLAYSDLDRSYTYEFCDAALFPVCNYQATIRVLPVVESSGALVEWWAVFDCPAGEYEHWTNYFEKDGFAKWLASLRSFMATGKTVR